MKVLITGSMGMLGKDVIEILSQDQNLIVYGLDRITAENSKNQLVGDLLDFGTVERFLKKINPDAIVHCAANVNVDECEKNKKAAEEINVTTTDFLSRYNPQKTKFIYISSDAVFNGTRGNYMEEDKPCPINYYARTKLEGEKVSLKNNVNTVVLRTNIYGFHIPPGKSLVEWAIENLKNKNSINGFTDVFFNPVYTKQLARMILLLIKEKYSGILNIGSDCNLSKYDFLVRLSEVFGFPSDLIRKIPVTGVKFIAPRPKNTTLNTEKLKRTFNVSFSFNTGMEELKNDYQQKFFSKED